ILDRAVVIHEPTLQDVSPYALTARCEPEITGRAVVARACGIECAGAGTAGARLDSHDAGLRGFVFDPPFGAQILRTEPDLFLAGGPVIGLEFAVAIFEPMNVRDFQGRHGFSFSSKKLLAGISCPSCRVTITILPSRSTSIRAISIPAAFAALMAAATS